MRIKRLRLHTDSYLDLLKLDPFGQPVVMLVDHPLPKDARVIHASYDDMAWLWLIVESSEFDEVREGDLIPILDSPTFRLERREPNALTQVV